MACGLDAVSRSSFNDAAHHNSDCANFLSLSPKFPRFFLALSLHACLNGIKVRPSGRGHIVLNAPSTAGANFTLNCVKEKRS